jgi:hypothetical protein
LTIKKKKKDFFFFFFLISKALEKKKKKKIEEIFYLEAEGRGRFFFKLVADVLDVAPEDRHRLLHVTP